MRKKTMLLLWALCVLVFGAGCSSFEPIKRIELPAEQTALIAEYADIYREVAAASPFVVSLDGYADVWIKTPKREKRVFCNIRVNRGEEVRMIVSAGLIGWPVADMFLSKDSLYVHDMINNRLFVGSNNSQNLEKILGVNSGYRLLTESLLGLVSIDEPVRAIRSVKKGEGKLLFSFENQTGGKEVVIDLVTRTLSALLLKNSQGKTTTELHFRNFESITIDNRRVLVPKEIDMLRFNNGRDSSGEQQLVIAYDERTFNKGSFSGRFSIPKKVKIINLDNTLTLPWM
ncbi:MAG: DUF4292 domain-containing protein [Chlorobiaceae bacterium]